MKSRQVHTHKHFFSRPNRALVCRNTFASSSPHRMALTNLSDDESLNPRGSREIHDNRFRRYHLGHLKIMRFAIQIFLCRPIEFDANSEVFNSVMGFFINSSRIWLRANWMIKKLFSHTMTSSCARRHRPQFEEEKNPPHLSAFTTTQMDLLS